ncbi:hypothetical protein [Hymenobacter sp. DG25A]|uniref:hypothetical protein n=1 Tax=Hymenobacter sp. DG25A TaxID=1385663 RepID=UPI0006BD67A1|nr:hypothetical protein [Hymenobacter sp. DG25A]ALD20218.1 hypothetical protein AM218_01950 [Hymenobacter sp. DG25A]
MRYLFYTCCFLVVLGGSTPRAWGQAPVQPARFELAITPGNSDVSVFPLPDSSAVLLVRKDAFLSPQDSYTFHKLNTRLQERWQHSIKMETQYQQVLSGTEGNQVYVLFQSNYLPSRLLLVHLDGNRGTTRLVKIDTRVSRDLFDLKVLAGRVFVTTLVSQHVTILHINPESGEFQFLPSVYESLPAQFTFLADSVTKRAEVILTQTNGLKSRLQVKQLSPHGNLLRTEFVQTESDRNLISAQISSGDSTSRILAGTYTLRDLQYSQGLFAADLTAGVTATGARKSLRFYDFLAFKHFFDFMNPVREARLRERGARRKAAGVPMRLHYRLLMHDMLPTPQGYIMVAEVYYPRYRYDNVSGSLGLSNTRQFEGYRTTHAIACGFDKQGNLLWDNTFVLKDNWSYELAPTVRERLLPDGRLALAYIIDHKIHYKIIDRTAPAPNDLQVPVRSSLSDLKEKLSDTQQEEVLPWFGSRFLVYGYQHVRPEKGESRSVFFVNSLAFEQ